MSLPPEAFRAWLASRLDPLDAASAKAAWARADFDLDPGGASAPPASPIPAAVLVCLVHRPEGHSVILTRRSDSLRSHTGQVALPGGRCEPGETPWAAALREAEEEIGLARARVTLGGLSTPYRTGTGFHVTPVVGFVEPEVSLAPNPDEVADIFEAPFDLLMDLSNYEPREGRTPAGDVRRYYALTWRDQLIWGATAGMLRALSERLSGDVRP